MKAFKSIRFLTRTRKAKRRYGVSFHDHSVGFHAGKPSLYVFHKLPVHKLFNRLTLSVA
jgi:hypothetical protein